MVWRAFPVLLLLLFKSEQVFACPVCFGNASGSQIEGARMAVMSLLGVIVVLLMGFAAFFIYLARKAKMSHEKQIMDE